MARERSPNRDKAYELFKKANGNIMNREIADQLEISEKTVGGWKSKDKWLNKLNGVLHSNERSTPFVSSDKRGAPPGNKNAKGNKGNRSASAPKRNKNAVKTGEYETIFADYLTDDELDTFEIEVEPTAVITEEIKLLRVRQRRMLQRIRDAENGLNQKETDQLFELRGRKKLVESNKKRVSVEIPELVITQKKEKTYRKINDILAIEDALTRVSNQLQKAIKQLNELNVNDYRVELMKEQAKKVKAETTELGGATSGDEVEDWKKAVIEAANKRAMIGIDESAVADDE